MSTWIRLSELVNLHCQSVTGEPDAYRLDVTGKDRRRLRTRTELTDPQQPTWQLLAPNQRDRARDVLAILVR
jgi:hypothetical protein